MNLVFHISKDGSEIHHISKMNYFTFISLLYMCSYSVSYKVNAGTVHPNSKYISLLKICY